MVYLAPKTVRFTVACLGRDLTLASIAALSALSCLCNLLRIQLSLHTAVILQACMRDSGGQNVDFFQMEGNTENRELLGRIWKARRSPIFTSSYTFLACTVFTCWFYDIYWYLIFVIPVAILILESAPFCSFDFVGWSLRMALKAIRAMAKYSKDKDALWGIQAGTAATPVSGSIWQYLVESRLDWDQILNDSIKNFYLVSNLNLVWGQSNFSESSLETMAVGAARSRLLRWSTSHTCTTTRSTSFWRASSRRQRLRFGIVSHRFDGIRTNRSFPKAHGSHSNASAYAIHTHSLVMSHDYLSPALCYWNIWNPQDSDSQDSPDSQQIFLCRTHAKQSGKRASPWINHVLSSPGHLTCTLTKRGA